jgi:hypothetical protein
VKIEPIKDFKIENRSEADAYLSAISTRPEYSMDDVEDFVLSSISDQKLRKYVIDSAAIILGNS